MADFAEIGRWYAGLAALPAWQDATAASDTAMRGLRAKLGSRAPLLQPKP
ncbi:MAG: hypothetical protein JO326_09165 [Acetobacteraceae bacterium]|nr:hypothetical protein [Acetobacteraceae bacterium]